MPIVPHTTFLVSVRETDTEPATIAKALQDAGLSPTVVSSLASTNPIDTGNNWHTDDLRGDRDR